MSVACEVCQLYHDHNIMEHIYKLEYRVRSLELALEEAVRNSPTYKESPGTHGEEES